MWVRVFLPTSLWQYQPGLFSKLFFFHRFDRLL